MTKNILHQHKTVFLTQIVKNNDLKAPNPLYNLIFHHSHVICMSLVCTHMSSVCHSYVLVCHLYVTRMYSYVIRMSLVCTRISFVCHSYVLVCHSHVTHMYSYVIRMSLICTRMSFVCHLYGLVCHPYVTRMYSYIIRMSLVCTRMLSVCHSLRVITKKKKCIKGSTIKRKYLRFYQKSNHNISFKCHITSSFIETVPQVLFITKV